MTVQLLQIVSIVLQILLGVDLGVINIDFDLVYLNGVRMLRIFGKGIILLTVPERYVIFSEWTNGHLVAL